MKTIRFERRDSVGSIVLANPPYNRIDARFPVTLREALHEASASDIHGPHAAMKNQEGDDIKITGEPHARRAMPSLPVAARLLCWERSEPLRRLRMSRGPAEANVEV